MAQLKILDTNILLLDAQNLVNLGKDGSTIVLSETVLNEVDSKKSGHSEIAFQARETGRLLSKATKIDRDETDELIITRLDIYGTRVDLVSAKSYADYTDTEINVINDRKIIEIAKKYHDRFTDDTVTFVCNDVMCRHYADVLGLNVTDLQYVETTDIEFVRTLSVDDELFRTLHNSKIESVDEDYEPNVFNYKFVNTTTGQMKLATVSNGSIQVIGKDTEADLRRQDLNPANSEQLFFSKALQDTSIDINICEAKAGSGKTALAISNGVRMVRQGKYDSIIYIRASVDDVDKAEEVGFLSGNDEKLQVYLHPLEDTLDFIVRNRFKDTKMKSDLFEKKVAEEIEKLRGQCNIEAMIGLGLRGRTFHNAYVIIDEAQNQSKSSVQKMLTRIGKGCKVVVIGSNKQIDNAYLTKYTNGLSTLLEACTKEHEGVNLHAVSLPKVLRGSIAEFAENLYSS